jgi:hypothetical protein
MKIAFAGKRHLFVTLVFVSLIAGSVLGQESNSEYAPSDTVFREIRLSNAGVTAVDVEGYDWYYDFERSLFAAGTPEDELGSEIPEDLEDLALDYVPVEERCTRERKVKPFLRSVLIASDEYVDDDIVAYGRVTIKGWVKGNVTSIDNRVLVTRTGWVDGDITAPEIVVRKGGVVLGQQNTTEAPLDIYSLPGSFSVDGMIVVASMTVAFLFFGFLVVTLMPGQLNTFSSCLATSRLKAYFIGLFFIFVMPVIFLLLAITIVGVVLIPLVPFVYLFAIILGVVSFGDRIGQVISSKLFGGRKGLIFQSMIGVAVFMGLWFVTATLLGSNYRTAEGFGILFLVLSILISTYPVCTGVGAAVMTRFGFKTYTGWRERRHRPGGGPTPAPPPIPKAPPEPSPSIFDDESDETSPPSSP